VVLMAVTNSLSDRPWWSGIGSLWQRRTLGGQVHPQRCSGAALAGLLGMPSSCPLLGVVDLPAAGGHLQISASVLPLPAWLPGSSAAPPLSTGRGGEGVGWCGIAVVCFSLPGRPWWRGGRPAQGSTLWHLWAGLF
jgi:hypothetical protein